MKHSVSVLQLGPDAQRQVAQKLAADRRVETPRQKYGNIAEVVDGLRFASRREAARYLALKAEEARGEIRNLKVQPAFRVEINGALICDYVADFAYFRGNERVVEDVKSKATRTPEYRLKRKLVEAIYHIRVAEVE
jgi:hypothetical protein